MFIRVRYGFPIKTEERGICTYVYVWLKLKIHPSLVVSFLRWFMCYCDADF